MIATVTNRNLIFPDLKNARSTNYYGRTVHWHKKETISHAANTLWLIKKGIVKTITWSEAGKTIILGYWGEGDVIGSSLSTANPYEMQCLNAVEAVSIPLQDGSYLFREISRCIQQTDELLRIIRTEKMYDRLFNLLIWLADKFGSPLSQGMLINIRLTHQELADFIGSTRVTVTRLLNQLEQAEMIIRPRRFAIVIKDFGLLKSEARSSGLVSSRGIM